AAMPHDWRELFLVDTDHTPPAQEPGAPEPERRRGFFRRLRENLSKTRAALGAEIHATLFDTLDDETWERLEEALIMADVGAATTAEIVGTLEREATEQGLEGGAQLTERLIELMAGIARAGTPTIDLRHDPTVIMVCGVNGTGKTTSIGKIAWHIKRELSLSVVLGAADTFRAAAVEQLEEWARRAGCEIVTGAPDSDPGAVAFDAVTTARAANAD